MPRGAGRGKKGRFCRARTYLTGVIGENERVATVADNLIDGFL